MLVVPPIIQEASTFNIISIGRSFIAPFTNLKVRCLKPQEAKTFIQNFECKHNSYWFQINNSSKRK